jgi:hypothetical protein
VGHFLNEPQRKINTPLEKAASSPIFADKPMACQPQLGQINNLGGAYTPTPGATGVRCET